MNRYKLFTAVLAGGLLAACESGDVNIAPSTTVGDTITNPGGGGSSPDDICASYLNDAGQTIQGSADANGNCTYGSAFVGPKNELKVDLLLPALPDGAAHIFTSPLFVGQTYRTIQEANDAGIFEGGDGPTLTIEAGATIALSSSNDFIAINRGSRLIADGRADAPITITSVTDIANNLPEGPESVQQIGGMVINGFGVSSECSYVGGVRPFTEDADADGELDDNPAFALDPADSCSILVEGLIDDNESHFGGDNDNDDSGILRYVIIKHTGEEVSAGNELNGITFGAVGRSTVVENLQTYSTFDDGIEMFGGAVNFKNYVGLYVRDDAIDIDDGWIGTIDNALVIQSELQGNHCIESDGLAGFGDLGADEIANKIAQGLNSRPTINNLTCIVSASDARTQSAGRGWLFREGIWPTVNNALVISSFGVNEIDDRTEHYCVRIRQTETVDAAVAGDLQINSAVFACQYGSFGEPIGAFADEQAWAESNSSQFAAVAPNTAVNATAAADTDLQLLEGTPPVYSIPWATSFVDGAAPDAATEPTNGDFLGGVSLADDWIDGWTYGIQDGNRGQPLWFE